MLKWLYDWWYAIEEETEVKPLPPLENSTN